MENSTYSHPLFLMLSFGKLTEIKYLYGSLVLLCFLTTALANSVVISAILLHRNLQEPMYLFIACLCVSGLYGNLVFFPGLFVNLLSKTQTISYVACLIQVFGIHTYVSCEVTILAVMAFDRYVCICNPLRYNSIMSLPTVYKLILATWLYGIIQITIHIILTIRLPLCGVDIQKFYCDNWSVVKLSCVDTTVNNLYGVFITVTIIGLMPLFTIISYVKILRVCLQYSKPFRAKAFQTCTPHLITFSYFLADILFETLLNRYPVIMLPYELRVIISAQGFVFAPLLNPLVYGLQLREIRRKTVEMFVKK